VEQKKEYRIEDMNAAAVVYMPVTPNRDPTPEMPEMPEERGGGREERSENALHRNGAG
jgi:hypothetical protein